MLRRFLPLPLAFVLAFATVLIGATPSVAADPTADLQIQKSVDSPGPYRAGDTFSYTIVVGCSSTNELGCFNTALTDSLPAPLEFDPSVPNPVVATLSPAGDADVTVTEDGFTVAPLQPLDDEVGLRAGASMTVTVSVRVPPDASADFDGDTITNTAAVVADNADRQTSSADVRLEVETTLVAGLEKSAAPRTVPAVPGKNVTWGLSPSNESNQTVDAIVVEDVFDGQNAGYLDFAGIDTEPAPETTDSTTVEYLVEGDWTTTAPDDLTAVEGVRVTYEGSYAPGVSADVRVRTTTNDTVADIAAGSSVTVENEATATVVVDDEVSDPVDDDASVNIEASNPTVSLSKAFDDSTLVVGQDVTATVTATVGAQNVQELVINEPSEGSSTFTEQGLEFTGVGDVQWPEVATSASITYTYSDCAPTTESTTTENSLPGPQADCTVEGFSVTFTAAPDSDGISGSSYAELGLGFTALTDIEEALESTNVVDTVVTNTDGAQGDDSAEAPFTIRPLEVLTNVEKRITPSEIFGVPGAEATVSLPAAVSPESTIGSDRLVIQDPADPTAASTFFDDYFDPTAITNTEIPSCTHLTVRYWDGDGWVVFPGAENVAGPVAAWNYTIPNSLRSQIGGIQYEFTPLASNNCPQLLPPGFNVLPRLKVEVQDGVDIDDQVVVPNDVESQVYNNQIQKGDTARNDDEVTLLPVDGEGPDLVDKQWLDDDVPALSGQSRTARIHWSTQGLNFANMAITDPATAGELGPDVPDIATSVYDAFDLTAINAITPATDPLIAEDRISKVELYLDGAWTDVTAAACPSAAACTGAFPRFELSDTQQAGTTGVRLTYTERTAGEGVGSSTDRRPLDLDFRVRDTLRSDPSQYVLGEFHDHTYNTTDPGVVNNTVNARGFGGRSGEFSSNDGDRINILDAPFNVDITKEFDQDSLGLPSPDNDVDPADYPLISADLVATNNSAGKLSSMVIADPATGSTDSTVYNVANLYDIDEIVIPEDLDEDDVTVRLDRDGTTEDVTYDEALALGPDDLADVTGVTLTFARADGAPVILNEAVASVKLTWQLRADQRDGSGPVVPGGDPVLNEASVKIDSPGLIRCEDPPTGEFCSTGTDEADDEFNIVDANYEVEAQKVIRPDANPNGDFVYEDQSKNYTTTLRGRPLGSARTTLMTLTDDTTKFWNTMNYVSASINLPRPINSVRMDAKVGDTWVEGDWVDRLASGSSVSFALPSDITDPTTVVGVRFSFRQLDTRGLVVQWERPYNPNIAVALKTTRRDVQRSGGPVSTTLPGLAPNEGETVPGLISDDLQVHGDAQFGPTQSFDDDETAEDTTLVRHRPNAIKVEKTPGNPTTPPLYAPGGTIPYVLKITNTGSWAMTGLEVTDQIDLVDGEVPVTEPTPTAYAFSLTGPGAPSTTPAFSASLDPVTGELKVTMPAGFVFRPNWVLTVQAPLVLKASIDADQLVANSVTATSDRDFERCESTLDGRARAATTDVETCTATTHVQPRASATLAMTKGVKGDEAGEPGTGEDDLGVLSLSGSVATCAQPQADGFYRGSCVPVTRPGGQETWKLSFRNTGNTNAKVIAAVDTLPAVGDRGVITSAARGSAFNVQLMREYAVDLSGVQNRNATVRAYYSTERLSTSCNTNAIQVHTANATPNPGCAFGWTLYDATTPDSELAQAQSVKFVVDWGTAGQRAGLRPGETAGITFNTKTPVNLPRAFGPGVPPVAYNSFAAASRTVATDTQPERAEIALEPTRVGVATAPGHLTIDKVVEAPEFSIPVTLPGRYTFALECTLDDEDVVLRNAAGAVVDGTVTVEVDEDGGSSVVNTVAAPVSLPLFASCAVTETPVPTGADVTYDPQDRTVVADADLGVIPRMNHPYRGEVDGPTLTAANTYSAGGFTIAKTVDDGGAVDQDGEPIAYDRDYVFDVACSFQDVEILSEEVTLQDGGTKTYEGLPTGSECSAEETDTTGATVTLTVDGEEADNPAEFEIVRDGSVAVAALNTFTTGGVSITKQITGPGRDRWDDQEFEVRLVCTLDLDGDGQGSGQTVFDDTSVLTAPDHLTWDVANLPTGASCTVTEPRTGGANQTTIEPDTFTVGSGEDVAEVSVENYFEQGVVRAVKTLSGDAASNPVIANGTYVMSLSCTREVDGQTLPVAIPDGADRTITGAGTAEWDRLPTGATCVVAEKSSTPQASGVTLSPEGGQVVVDEVDPVEVTVDNRFDDGYLRINKLVDGPGEGLHGDDAYTFDVDCTLADQSVLEQEVTLTREDGSTSLWSDVLGPLPTGSSCHVVETGQAAADDTTREATVVIDDGTTETPVVATITNTYGAGTVEITKEVSGRYADRREVERMRFDLTVTCEIETTDEQGQPVRGTVLSADVRLKPGRTKSFSQLLPVGTHCHAAETDDRGASEVKIEHDSYDTAAVVESSTQTAQLSLVVENVFDEDIWSEQQEDCPECDSGLSGTGSDVSPGLVALGALGVIAGGAAVAAAVRRRRAA